MSPTCASGFPTPASLVLLFDSSGFAPHGFCYQWDWRLILLHVASDALIAVAYMSIPVTLLYFVRQRRDLPFHWIFVLFGVFIVACGGTHMMEIWTLWHAHYWASGALKAVTAMSSVLTAILLVKIVPAALALPRPEELQAANRALETQAERIREQAHAVAEAKSESEWFINSVPSILIGTNHEGKIIRWNFEAVETFGLTESEVVGKTLKDCGVKWVQEQTFTEIDSWMTRKYPHKAANLCFEKQGETRFLGVTIDQLRLADDRAGGLLITGTDITRRLLLEGQLRQAQKLEAIGQLAAGIAHEINTPTQYVGDNAAFIKESWTGLDELLRTVRSIAEQGKAGVLPADTAAQLERVVEKADLDYLLDEIPRALNQTLDGVRRVANIVQAMKEFSHPGGDEKAPIDINHAIDTTLTVARNEWKYVAEVKTEFDRTLPLVPCLAGEFNQVILNLVTNAAHAISDKNGNSGQTRGKITIRTRREDDWAEIQIEDTGCGVAERNRSRVFELFFTTKEAGRGTGQGLALAHTIIVKKHGGQIWFQSEEGRGTTFFVRLPLGKGGQGEEMATMGDTRKA
jgi:two-component system, NtrC family, sensor kinase